MKENQTFMCNINYMVLHPYFGVEWKCGGIPYLYDWFSTHLTINCNTFVLFCFSASCTSACSSCSISLCDSLIFFSLKSASNAAGNFKFILSLHLVKTMAKDEAPVWCSTKSIKSFKPLIASLFCVWLISNTNTNKLVFGKESCFAKKKKVV